MASNPAASLKVLSAAHAGKGTAPTTDKHGDDDDHHDDEHHDDNDDHDDNEAADPEDVRGRRLHYNNGYNRPTRRMLAGNH
jgi:hypothetical protein